ncbi:MAG: amino acid racemase [Gemmatimonadales bacterium]|nr:amino acid racemase [Gemmatimonadales bacterium]NIN10872.1 amino acid racemase [Gemmatimonadales bacterium]NIR02880.1 amino acid racemase [Gemmatimonadales bacterium]NIS66514.1 amino acid racemase [Gemmatimonadales bacterium]
MKTIGIFGGLGPASTIAYYQYITDQYYAMYGDYGYPPIIIYSLDFQKIIDVGYEAPGIVQETIEKLHRAGADFAVASCNSIHIVYDEVAEDIPIPWISIMDVTGESIKAAEMTKVGLLGTIFTMGKGFYQRGLARYGIETITPAPEDQSRINEIIFKQLVRGVFTDDSRQVVLQCIEKLSRSGVQGVVLGCTEIPLLVQQEHTEVPLFDTTTLHAQRALDVALETVGV